MGNYAMKFGSCFFGVKSAFYTHNHTKEASGALMSSLLSSLIPIN